MDENLTFLTLFLLGFFGGGHCVGMCGGLSSAFALQLPPNLNRFGLIVLLNLGRVSSYVLIGFLVGLIGQAGISLDDTRVLQQGLYIAANILLLLLGLYLAGISTAATRIERIGKPIWKAAESVFKQAFAYPFRPSLFRRRDALGLAAVRSGLQRVALRLGQRQRGSRRFIYVGFCTRHAA